MADYISRDYTVENMENYPWYTEHDKNAAIHLVRELVPAADVRPVVSGRWEWKNTDALASFAWTCSACGQRKVFKTNFCPNCGADMRENKSDQRGEKEK